MAAIESRNGSHRIKFRHEGRQRSIRLGKVPLAEAEARLARVEYLLTRLRNGDRSLPGGVEIEDYLLSDGSAAARASPGSDPTFAELRDRYLETHRASLEPRTVEGIELHFRHLAKRLGDGFRVRGLKLADLQGYVDARSRRKVAGRPLSPATIKKELVSLRTAWNWAARMDLVSGRFPSDGLRFPRGREKPPFQTRAEIERQVSAGGLDETQRRDLWSSLYLQAGEIAEALDAIRAKAIQPWVHPMAAAAAYTGARRSELARMRRSDVDLDGGSVVIREKKRVKGRDSMRRVPLTPALVEVLRAWLAVHPGGPLLFRHADVVDRSKRRGATAGVGGRQRPGVEPLTEDETHDHLKRAMAGSAWSCVRGWHVFRHSFISACASAGVDQRLIDEWVGHTSEEMRRRYRHLYPSVQRDVIRSVFGGPAAGPPSGS